MKFTKLIGPRLMINLIVFAWKQDVLFRIFLSVVLIQYVLIVKEKFIVMVGTIMVNVVFLLIVININLATIIEKNEMEMLQRHDRKLREEA